MPPSLLHALSGVVVVVLEGFVDLQNSFYVLFTNDNGRIRVMVILEISGDPAEWIVVKNSLTQKKSGGVIGSPAIPLRRREVRNFCGRGFIA